jgi:hypothetical protein
MKNLFSTSIVFLFVSVFSFIFAQESEVRKFSGFHGVAASASVDAELVKGSENKVTITVENYELEDVETEIEGGVLRVGMKSKGWNNGSWKKRKVHALIEYNGELDHLSVGASADLIAKNVISGDKLKIEVSSSGDMTLEVDVKELYANVSSSGDLNIRGKANRAKVVASSSADFEGSDLEVDEAELIASSSADITIHVNNSLKATASSSADIEYSGNPSVKDITKSSQASVSKS